MDSSIPSSKYAKTTLDDVVFKNYPIDLHSELILKIQNNQIPLGEILPIINPVVKNFFHDLCSNVFKDDRNLTKMYLRHQFIIIDSNDSDISSYMADVDSLFEDDNMISFEKRCRKTQSLLSCVIDLSKYSITHTNCYYLFFLINRCIETPKLLFLGYMCNSDESIIKKSIFIDYLIRFKDEFKDHSDSSKLKKEKKEHQKRGIMLSFPSDDPKE